MLSDLVLNILRRFPNSYVRSFLLNLGGIFVAYFPFPCEEYTLDGVRITIMRDPSFRNSDLQQELKGYNRLYKLRWGDTVIDVGAYTGFYTIYAAKKVGPKGRVIAMEPDPYSLMRLKRNIKLNNVNNITIISKGLYSRDAVLKFETQTVCSRIVDDENTSHTLNSIRVTTLDKLMSDLALKHVDFVKMDIEGAELEAIKSCRKAIAGKAHFAIASYHVVDGIETHVPLEAFFKKHHRRATTGYKRHLTTYV